MTAQKHTPGPWSNQRSPYRQDGEFDYAIHSMDVKVLAEVFGRDAHGGRPNAEANAHLIAAAPELLEALRVLRDECMGFVPKCADQVDAAIAKATGQ